MKNASLFVNSIIILVVSSIFLNGCRVEVKSRDYLQKVLDNLDNIKSATYFSKVSVSAPYDTVVFKTFYRFTKEHVNTADTFIGSNFASFGQDDTTRMNWLYNGDSITYLNWDEKTIDVNNFRNIKLPFRPIGPPFFNYTRSIIKYALETQDSILIDLKDYGDSVQFTLNILDKAVEFFGKPCYMDSSFYQNYSRYNIWIRKSDNLPYRYRRALSNNTSWEACNNIILNNINIKDFTTSKYIPPDFTIPTRDIQKTAQIDLVGKQAPDWILKDFNNNSISLNKLTSKVLMIQFTGIGCGPCHQSISFLKQLVTEYKLNDFGFVSIETWSKNSEGLKRYKENNDLNYTFLLSTEEIKNKYHVSGVPIFFILDQNRIIRKIIAGYGKGTTDEEIRDAINELI